MKSALRIGTRLSPLSVMLLMACAETAPSIALPDAPAETAETSSVPISEQGSALEQQITGGTDRTVQESLQTMFDHGMDEYALGQQRALAQWLGTETALEQGQQEATVDKPEIPASLQQLSDQILLQYKQQIGVDPETRVAEPKL